MYVLPHLYMYQSNRYIAQTHVDSPDVKKMENLDWKNSYKTYT